MRQVRQFHLPDAPGGTVSLPENAVVLTAASRKNGDLCLFAEVDVPLVSGHPRHFYVLPTNGEVPGDGCMYVDTVEDLNGAVLHVYEEPRS
jgi:hypothetical protein